MIDNRQWQAHLLNRPLILDGATGTLLQAAGLPAGVCPEHWVLENPAHLQAIQREYYLAGSDIVYTFSFGANRIKLTRHGIAAAEVERTNQRLARLSCEVRDHLRAARPDRLCLVAGDLAPTGEFLRPAGNLGFAELIDIYREQVRGLLAGDVDLFVAETLFDLAQARAAVLAVRAECDLPVLVSLTVEKNSRTLGGNSLRECVVSLAALGASAVGLNCSCGPEALGDIVREILADAPCPILVKPNAGLPQLVDGRTVFKMAPAEFAQAMTDLAQAGVAILGGCCGTEPAHIAALRQQLDAAGIGRDPESARAAARREAESPIWQSVVCSARQTVSLIEQSEWPTVNCENVDDLPDDVLTCQDDEPALICIDLGCLEPTDGEALADSLETIQMMVPVPLIFRGEQPELLKLVSRVYQGRTAFLTSAAGDFGGSIILS